ncbi:hypothetical protein LUZ62_017215 [Rhynchospora pubera]|uniref:UvrABC system protein A n=1 Tax=Rhynchospora pubera TaxID=906938 RepID=A0AAV8E243_9POAL|nr:UvrABC system protein A [Rhynchospora pubera]KAJ4786525.1 UvrABC system protein A [Rhynchospora pubera]KAJ4804649.1 hypothetical protein LUZ62_017215 [Rhynchospora pubera]
MAEQLVFSSPPKDGALLLPVFLSEGSERLHVGTLSVHPSVGFRNLQLALSRTIGVPPYQMTSFLVRPTFQRIPIDEKMDLSVVSREGGEWHVLSVVRRSRKGRNRGRRTKGGSRVFAEDPKPQPEKILLRRNDASNTPVVYDLMHGPTAMMPMLGHFYQPPMYDFQTKREGSLQDTWYLPETPRFWRDTWYEPGPPKAVCAVCEAAAYLGVEAAFHCCPKDEIVEVGSFVGSPVGPIERPSGNRVEGCA